MGAYIVPVPNGISRGFGDGHSGIDYLSPVGTEVKASGDGTVSFAGNGADHSWFLAQSGNCILLKHADIYTGYAHLSRIVVKSGQQVKTGEVIGYTGNTGVSTGPHLHFEFIALKPDFKNGYSGRVEPSNYLSKGGNNMAYIADAELADLRRWKEAGLNLQKERDESTYPRINALEVERDSVLYPFVGSVMFALGLPNKADREAAHTAIEKLKAGSSQSKPAQPVDPDVVINGEKYVKENK